ATDGAEHLRRCEKPTLTCKLLLAGGGPTGNKPAEPYGPGFNPAAAGAVFLYHRLPRWRLASHLLTRPSRTDSLVSGAKCWRRFAGYRRGALPCPACGRVCIQACGCSGRRAFGHWLTGSLHRPAWLPIDTIPSIWWSGAEDFSVALWDCESGSLIHLFCVHGGPGGIAAATPNGCQGSRLAVSVVSVAADHSQVLLNLRERRLFVGLSGHLYPVLVGFWRRSGLPIVLHFNVACLIERILSNDQLARLRSQSRDSETQESSRSPYLGGRSGPQLPDFPMLHRPELPCHLSTPPPPQSNATTGADEQALTLQVAQLLLSLIHSWGLDTGLDRTGRRNPGPLAAPYRPLFRSGPLRAACLLLCPNPPPHWETNRQLTHFAPASHHSSGRCFGHSQDRSQLQSLAARSASSRVSGRRCRRSNSRQRSNGSMEFRVRCPPPTAEQRQAAWGLTLTHHTVLLADLLDPSLFQQPCLLSLAGLYHTASPHLRQAAQQLLMAELRRLGPAGRQELLGQHDLSLKTSLASLVLVCLICCEFPAGQSDLNLTRAAAGALIRLLQEPGQAGGEMAPCGFETAAGARI
uniref:WD_REPEATS_REGION domain-containing protein n=1 Tax=Macrostomum lignano TaxID=282301 RepID=A0A1I8FRW8_9PLAT